MAVMTPVERAELRHLVESRLVPAFSDLAAIEADVCDWAEDRRMLADEPLYETRRMWTARLAEQRRWTMRGDYTRLDEAFAELADHGILTRMNFCCCTRCATRSIGAQRSPAPDATDGYRYREWGYVYFHEQDAESLADDEPRLRLGFGRFRAEPDGVEPVADLIVGALDSHGLRGQVGVGRIVVDIDEWRKPLPGSAVPDFG